MIKKSTCLCIFTALCCEILSAQVTVENFAFGKKSISRDGIAPLTFSLLNKGKSDANYSIEVIIKRENNIVDIEPLHRIYSKKGKLAPSEKTDVKIEVGPSQLRTWHNGSKTTACGRYTAFIGDTEKNASYKSATIIVDDKFDNPENGFGAPYLDKNPFKDAMLPVPESAIFKMPGYSLWCPSVIEHDGTFHLFCSRWKRGEHWGRSHIIRATSKNLFGPYEFKEVVMDSAHFPYKFGKTGLHNPKIIKIKDTYYLYCIALPGDKNGVGTAFASSKSPEGPWKIVDHIVIDTNNPAICQSPDGGIYALGKENIVTKEGGHFRTLPAFKADTILGEYKAIEGGKTRLPYNFEHEDPTVWYANNQYNVILTDWAGKITNEQKSVVYFFSKDGVNYTLFSPIAIWRISDKVPVKYVLANGESEIREISLKQVERPQVHLNNKGEVDALLVAVIPPCEPAEQESFIMIRPINNFVPKNK